VLVRLYRCGARPTPASADGDLGGSAARAARSLLWLSRLSEVLAATPPCCSSPPCRGVCDTATLRHARHPPPPRHDACAPTVVGHARIRWPSPAWLRLYPRRPPPRFSAASATPGTCQTRCRTPRPMGVDRSLLVSVGTNSSLRGDGTSCGPGGAGAKGCLACRGRAAP